MTDNPDQVPLGYVSFRERSAPMVLYVIALICGVAPLTVGLTCLFGYWLLDEERFVDIGVLTLPVGGLMVFCGFIVAFIYQARARNATIDQPRAMKRALIVLILLTSNILVAIFCTLIGAHLVSARTVPSNW